MTKESLLAQVMTPIVSARTMKAIVTKDEVGEISKYIRSQIYYAGNYNTIPNNQQL